MGCRASRSKLILKETNFPILILIQAVKLTDMAIPTLGQVSGQNGTRFPVGRIEIEPNKDAFVNYLMFYMKDASGRDHIPYLLLPFLFGPVQTEFYTFACRDGKGHRWAIEKGAEFHKRPKIPPGEFECHQDCVLYKIENGRQKVCTINRYQHRAYVDLFEKKEELVRQ